MIPGTGCSVSSLMAEGPRLKSFLLTSNTDSIRFHIRGVTLPGCSLVPSNFFFRSCHQMTTPDDANDNTTQGRVPPANGAWIKMRTNLWDDPRVASLCDALSCDEARVCGGLFRLWSLADTHSTDGRLQYSAAAVNRKVGIDGFAEAMQDVGWLTSVDGLMTLPRFDEHNGRSAKRRAQEAMRSAKHYRRQSDNEPLTQVSRSERENSVSERKRKSQNQSKKQNQNVEIEAAGRSPPSLASDFPPFDEIERHWNNAMEVSHKVTDSRRNKLLTRWKDAEFRARWREAIDRISRSNFCRGLNDRGWKADLDWFLKLDTITKVMEGKYDNHNATRAARGNIAATREQANADAFAAYYGPEAVDEDCVGPSALVFDEEDAGTDSASTRHLG